MKAINPSATSLFAAPDAVEMHAPLFKQPEDEEIILSGNTSPNGNADSPTSKMKKLRKQLEYYFSDENLKSDFFMLKNMDVDGYVSVNLFVTFRKVKQITCDYDFIRDTVKTSTELHLTEDESMIGRNFPLRHDQTYASRTSKVIVAYNLPEDTTVEGLEKKFGVIGTINQLHFIRDGKTDIHPGHLLKPPITCAGTYAVIEFNDAEMAKRAVLTLSDQLNWRRGLQVVMFDGTTAEKLQRKTVQPTMEHGRGRIDRRRAVSTASAPPRPVHVEAVGEGLDDLKEGKVEQGVIYSIRGAGGLINPLKYKNSCISFRLIPNEDGSCDYKEGDMVQFTVGRNKKSGRKYASKVKVTERSPPSSSSSTSSTASSSGDSTTGNRSPSPSREKDYFAGNSAGSWLSRRRASTSGASPPPLMRRSSTPVRSPPVSVRKSPVLRGSPSLQRRSSDLSENSAAGTPAYRQAKGPDGTRGFAPGRGKLSTTSQSLLAPPPILVRNRSASSGLLPTPVSVPFYT